MPRLSLGVWLLVTAAIPCAGSAELALPKDISVQRTAAGATLLDRNGRVLYTYARDSVRDVSSCVAECAKLWPPLPAESTAPSVRDWVAINRPDGTSQWSFQGKPLYTFAKDAAPRMALGDRVGQAWRVAHIPLRTPPGIALRSIHLGRTLVEARSLTLYWHEDEQPKSARAAKPRCIEECLREFQPLAAPLLANAVGEFSPLDREDGPRQWTYRGRPLYLHVGDLRPGDSTGQSAERGEWRAAVLEPAAPLPAWLTIQRADMGEIYADGRGFTLYTLAGSLERIRTLICNDECIRRNWRVVPAAANARPSGEWTVVESPLGDGARVWAYKGDALFTHTRDREPGAVGGDKWAAGSGGAGGGWNPLLRRRDYEQ